MKYRIDEKENSLDIRVDAESDEKKETLLRAFQECRDGRCACPTEEYKKLESLEIKEDDKSIHLRLKTKHGDKLDKAEINRCLEYTAGRVGGMGKRGEEPHGVLD